MRNLSKHFVWVLWSIFLFAAGAGPATQPDNPPNPADGFYADTLKIWASGDRNGTEQVLRQAVQSFPGDLRFRFILAADARSRFEIADADRELMYIADRGRGTELGRTALLIVALDQNIDTARNFTALDKLADKHPDDPMFLWMVAVECRSLKRTTDGIHRYAKLLTRVNPGPALVHQTYANLLDDASRSAEALPHRQLAVKMEPAGWTYDALGNTLSHLKRWDEADAAYRRSTSLAPNDAQYWSNWAWSKDQRGDKDGASSLRFRAAQAEQSQNNP
jgi:tetratricopeptide (TPR) repeat protein